MSSESSGRARTKPAGFPRSERVQKSDEFTHVLQNGRRVPGRFVNAYWVSGDDRDAPNRVGIAAGKKLGSAPVRNRVKRHIREAYRRNKGELPCRGMTIVFVASPRMIGRSFGEVQDEIRDLLGRLAGGSL